MPNSQSGKRRQIVEDSGVHRRQLIDLKAPEKKQASIVVEIEKSTIGGERAEGILNKLGYKEQLLH